jgi:tetratricopeptide (TPR) repeat protein
MSSKTIKNITVFILLTILGVAVYANTFDAEFHFDDTARILENRHVRIRNISFESLWDAAFGKGSSRSRPLGNISFALNYYIHRYDVRGYHYVNTAIHILSGIFLFLFLRLTFDTPALRNKYSNGFWIAAVGAAIWLAHPLHTQSVTYIIQRLNSMAAMLYIAAFYLYVQGRFLSAPRPDEDSKGFETESPVGPNDSRRRRRRRNIFFTGAFIAWGASLGVKQITVTLPAFVYLYEWFFFQNLDRQWFKRSLKYLAIVAILLTVLSIVFLGTNPSERFKSIKDYNNAEFTLIQRLLTQPRVVVHYLSLLVWPHPLRLNVDYDFPLSRTLLHPWTTLPAILFLAGLFVLALFIARKKPFISFAVFWYLGNLVIESSVIPLAIIFEHRTYLPSMLLWAIPALYLFRYLSLKLCLLIGAIVVAVFSVFTYQRNQTWATELTLWSDCVEKSPNKARPHVNLGAALYRERRVDDAIRHFRKALVIDPEFAEAHLSLGLALKSKGQIEEAFTHVKKGIRINPHNFRAYLNLGDLFLEQNRFEEARASFEKALEIKPQNHAVYNSLGVVFSETGDRAKAMKYLNLALQSNPDNADAHNNLANELSEKGRTDAAIAHYREALRIEPRHYQAYNNLGLELAAAGKQAEALALFKKAVEINPDYAEAHMNLGVAYQKSGELDKAIDQWQKTVELETDDKEAHFNLGLAMIRRDKLSPAIDHLRQALRIDPDFADAHNSLGAALIQSGRVDPALEHFQRALALDPEHADARKNLQKARTIMERVEADIRRLESAQRQNPGDPIAYFRLGELYFDIGRWEAAVDQYRKALQLDPGLAPALNNLALAYKRNEQYDEARGQFEKMINRWPEHAAGYYNLACVYALQNDAENALELLRKAIDKGYDNWEQIKTDSDLDGIRDSAAYQALIGLRAEEG